MGSRRFLYLTAICLFSYELLQVNGTFDNQCWQVKKY